ncbi:hypothetical protein [Burkholderia sp. SIMBA_062]|uniref:hypothetical protein n=1 Tax=Burkholderia sp. SIMBA_062 TaxID=3085803 RepID=UPI00397A356B
MIGKRLSCVRGKCARQVSYAPDSVIVGDSLDPQAGRQAVLKQIDLLTGEGLVGSLEPVRIFVGEAVEQQVIHAPA